MPTQFTQRLRHAWDGLRNQAEKADAHLAFGTRRDRASLQLLLPGSRYNYHAEAGSLWLNSAVAIGLGWITDNFPVPKLQVLRAAEGLAEVQQPSHPLLRLLNRPNPEYDSYTLWQATVLSYVVDGNAYWVKARSASGKPVELWWRPHWQIEPVFPSDGSQFISHYHYRVNGQLVPLDREDVIHFRDGIDPSSERRGMSRLKALVREICADNEANTFTVGILKNMGVPGLMISPPSGERINDFDVQAIKDRFREEFTGDQRGGVLVNPTGAKLEQVGYSPEDLALDRIRLMPEARICAALRLPPQVLGLASGEQTKTYTNYGEARRAAYQDCLMPMQSRFAETLTQRLLPDLGDSEVESLRWDYSRIDAFREAREDSARQAVSLFQAGLIDRDEARNLLGLGMTNSG